MRKLFFFFLFSRIIYITLFWLFFLLFRKIRYGLGFNLGKNWLGHRLDLPLSCHRALTWWVQWRPNRCPSPLFNSCRMFKSLWLQIHDHIRQLAWLESEDQWWETSYQNFPFLCKLRVRWLRRSGNLNWSLGRINGKQKFLNPNQTNLVYWYTK